MRKHEIAEKLCNLLKEQDKRREKRLGRKLKEFEKNETNPKWWERNFQKENLIYKLNSFEEIEKFCRGEEND